MSTSAASLAFAADSYAPSAYEVEDSPHNGRTVLLVDDDDSVLSLLGEIITAMGHKVYMAHDGRDALLCLLRHKSIDCLFTDVVMPNGMSGVQLMSAARAVRPGLPGLLASSYPRDDVSAMGEIPADVNFVAKPYLLTDLYRLLDAPPAHVATRTPASQRAPSARRKRNIK